MNEIFKSFIHTCCNCMKVLIQKRDLNILNAVFETLLIHLRPVFPFCTPCENTRKWKVLWCYKMVEIWKYKWWTLVTNGRREKAKYSGDSRKSCFTELPCRSWDTGSFFRQRIASQIHCFDIRIPYLLEWELGALI